MIKVPSSATVGYSFVNGDSFTSSNPNVATFNAKGELVAGDEVLIVNTEGESRTAYVGRSKIERRPLILIEAEFEGQTIRTLLQNAETIRIVDENNEPLSVADVKPGDKVKVYIESNARHFGIAIDETIIEQ